MTREGLRQSLDSYLRGILPYFRCDGHADRILALFDEYEASQWRPMSEPPKHSGHYLIYTTSDGVAGDFWDGAMWNHYDWVTHWRLFPPPPKAGE